MCTHMNTPLELEASGRGRSGWIALKTANVYYDHPFHLSRVHSLNIDFHPLDGEPEDRIALELSGASAAALAESILSALAAGELMTGEDHTLDPDDGPSVKSVVYASGHSA